MSYTFFGFRKLVAQHGIEQAIRTYALEDHTVSSIKKLLDAEKLTDAVDLVSGGRITLLFSKLNFSDTRADFDAAKDAGVDVGDVEWINREDMLKVSDSFISLFPVLLGTTALWSQSPRCQISIR
jgi:hypothetical protein